MESDFFEAILKVTYLAKFLFSIQIANLIPEFDIDK